jgi:hypothetical protein
MKRLLLAALCALVIPAYAQVNMPAPSPTQTCKQEFALGSIELTYSRPSVKDRKIFGNLVPFNKLWRTGANEATKLVFTQPVQLAAQKLDSGTYALYTIPGINYWEIILNNGIHNWGTEGYSETGDILRVRVVPRRLKEKLETFTIDFSDITTQSCLLNIKWDRTVVSIPITVDSKPSLKAQLDAAFQTANKPYWQAAQFYYEYETNLPKALDYVSKAIETNEKAYWMWIYKAKIQKDMGDMPAALESSKKSQQYAAEAGNDDYVQMNKELQKSLK